MAGPSTTPYHCDLCPILFFSSLEQLELHVTDSHSDKFYCDYCLKQNKTRHFGVKKSLIRHIKDNHLIGSFPCANPNCGKTYSSKRSLDRHEKADHSKSARSKCPKCVKTFSHRGDMLAHVRMFHKQICKSFKCLEPDCNTTCSTLKSLKQHLFDVHCKKGDSYLCANCDVSIKDLDEYKLHVEEGCTSTNILNDVNIVLTPEEHKTVSFKYALLCKFSPEDTSNLFQYEKEYNWTGITFPVVDPKSDFITMFENKNNCSISIFFVHGGKIFPWNPPKQDLVNNTDILHHEGVFHYIKDFDALVSARLGNTHGKTCICRRCGIRFYDGAGRQAAQQLEAHKLECDPENPTKFEMPSVEKSILKFQNYNRQKKIRFIAYLDFEALNVPQVSTSQTTVLHKHEPFAASYLLVDSESVFTKPLREYCGLDASRKIIEMLIKDVEDIERILYSRRIRRPPLLTEEQKKEFDECDACHVCGKGEFTTNNPKVIDHDHTTGKYRGCCHRICNIFFRDQVHIPVVVANLERYDAAFIVPHLGQVKVVPNSKDKFISFSKTVGKMELRFLDSYKFMPRSLSELSNNLEHGQKTICKSFFPNDKDFELITRKGVYPYTYMSDMDKLKETKLPPIEDFYNSLTDEDLESAEYEHAQNVWTHFSIKNMQEYTMLYLKTDVLLLADVFQNFRQIVHETYGLDPCYYLTAPSLAFDSMLKVTDVRLELFTDKDMHDFCRRGLRGGFVTAPLKYCEANNPYMGDLYDAEKPTSYIYNVDMNGLYATAMCEPLPFGGFDWVDPDEFIDIHEIKEDSNFGAFLEVTIEYPEHLHESHGDYPFLPTQEPNEDGNMCLMATVKDKEFYVLHHRSLQLAIRHGLILKKVHRILKFNQRPWCKEFVELNTKMRKASKNKFEEDFYKGFSNSAFGRSIMKLEDRVNIKIAKTIADVDKFSRNRLYKESYTVNENTQVFVMNKSKIVFNTPVYMGVAILDISKTIMYSFYYDYLKNMYGDNIHMAYSDTDSILAHVFTEDLYHDLKNSSIFERLDTSNYPKDHILYQAGRRFELGMAKDEAAGDLPIKYVGLCSKVYSKKKLILETGEIVVYGMKAKGIQKATLRKNVTFEDYFNSLMSKGNFELKLPNTRISSSKLQITTVTGEKKALGSKDPKRYLCHDGIHTLPFGDKRIAGEELKKEEEGQRSMVVGEKEEEGCG